MAGMNSAFQKEVARQLIDMHVRRGDAIFFVTGRSPTKTETVSKTLADNFSYSCHQYESGDLCGR